jgi:transglutaminase-like putative cysteine protease
VRWLIEHETVLAFPEPVREHQVELRLCPRGGRLQQVAELAIETDPAAPLREHVDCFGNRVHRLSLAAPHRELRVQLRARVETRLENPFAFEALRPEDEPAWLAQQLHREPRLHEFRLHRSAAVPELTSAATGLEAPARDERRTLLENVQTLMDWTAERFAYHPGATDVHAPLSVFFEKRAGVCQDFAHWIVAVVRSWGLPARYASGYVDPGSAPETAGEGATHAWAEVLVPGAGWRGFDATHGVVANDRYVVAAVGRDSRDAAPVRGAFKGEHAGDAPRVRLRVARDEQ